MEEIQKTKEEINNIKRDISKKHEYIKKNII